MGKKKKEWEFVFEYDETQKIKVIEDDEGVHVVAMDGNEENDDIERETVDRDNGETFIVFMDRIMDALEVIEAQIKGIETNTKTNIHRDSKQNKSSKSNKNKKKEESVDFAVSE